MQTRSVPRTQGHLILVPPRERRVHSAICCHMTQVGRYQEVRLFGTSIKSILLLGDAAGSCHPTVSLRSFRMEDTLSVSIAGSGV